MANNQLTAVELISQELKLAFRLRNKWRRFLLFQKKMSDADQETPKGPEVSVPPLKLKPLTEAAQKKEEERETRKSRKPTSQNIQDIVKSQLEPMFEMIKGLKEDQGQFFESMQKKQTSLQNRVATMVQDSMGSKNKPESMSGEDDKVMDNMSIKYDNPILTGQQADERSRA